MKYKITAIVLALMLVVGVGTVVYADASQNQQFWSNVQFMYDATIEDDLTVQDDTILTDDVTISGNVTQAVATGTENVGLLPTVVTAAITFESDGALFTIGAGEIWIIHGVWVEVTTNFDCTGDDCALTLGDAGDVDGLVVLADAELQAAAVDVTGGSAGWHGYMSDTLGAYIADGMHVYDETDAETIDIAIAGTDPAAGVGTVYVMYTRIQ